MTQNEGYYCNELVVITPNTIKIAIFAIFMLSVGLNVMLYATSVAMEIPLSSVDKSNVVWSDNVDRVESTLHLPLEYTISFGISVGIITSLMISKREVELRMNYIKKNGKFDTWDQTCEYLRSQGLQYPWWGNSKFWEISKGFTDQSVVE